MKNSNTFPERVSTIRPAAPHSRQLVRSLLSTVPLAHFLACLAILLTGDHAHALEPSKTISQYVHDHWGSDHGFLGGAILAISQSPDGYLWLGTDRGLVRFDGVDFTLLQRPIPGSPPIGAVHRLVTDAAGNMWIGLDGPHLLRYHNGDFEDAYTRFALTELAFTSIALDHEGRLLLWGPEDRLLRFQDGKFTSHPSTPDIPGIVISTTETADQSVWLGTRDIGLYQSSNQGTVNVSSRLAATSINALLPAKNNGLWIGTETGLEFWDGHNLITPALPTPRPSQPSQPSQTSTTSLDRVKILTLSGDRDGNVWAGTEHGLIRITPSLAISSLSVSSATAPRQSQTQNPDAEVTAIYEDREGAIWFGGVHGLDRLRDGMFTSYAKPQSLPPEINGPLYVDSSSRTWFAPQSGGLYWMKDGQVHQITAAGLDKDIIYSISGGAGEIWLGRQRGGLTVLTQATTSAQAAPSFTAKTYTQADGLASNSIYSVHRNHDGSVWAGTVSAGVSQLKDGQFKSFSTANGLASNAVFSIVEGHDGTTWFATPDGLASFSRGVWTRFGIADGLPSSNVRSLFEDSHQTLWIATSGGLAMYTAGHMLAPRSLTDALREEILGVAEDQQQCLWIVTADHVLQVNRERLFDGTLSDSDVLSYGAGDGLSEVQGVRRDRSIVTDSNGHVWLSLAHQLVSADPTFAAQHAAPVNVRIESASAAGMPIRLDSATRLTAGTRNIEFDYAASTLSNPQRLHFRYRLEGPDHGWTQTWSQRWTQRWDSASSPNKGSLEDRTQEWTNQALSSEIPLRQVVFTNLSPGPYRFRIQASSGLGQWSGPETTIPFLVEPAFWQTLWFRTAVLAACCLLTFAFYRWRLSLFAHRMNVRFQDRLAERTRIAQDLHDTLLQGVLSASMQLDLAEDKVPHDSPAKPILRRVLQLMRQVTEEGRAALRGLRTPNLTPGDDSFNLETALSRIRQEFAVSDSTTYRVVANGAPRPLRPLIRDDVYRIGREAVVNAFLHAHAKSIEVEVEYANRYLRLWVRDDGRGMDPLVLEAGREGHWGLPGMRERSETIGSSLRLRSRIGAGTEVELTTPGMIAFEGKPFSRISQWIPSLTRHKLETTSPRGRKRVRK